MLKPEKADFFYYRGNCYNKVGETQKALLDYSMAIRIEPKKAEYYEHRCVNLPLCLRLDGEVVGVKAKRSVSERGVGQWDVLQEDWELRRERQGLHQRH